VYVCVYLVPSPHPESHTLSLEPKSNPALEAPNLNLGISLTGPCEHSQDGCGAGEENPNTQVLLLHEPKGAKRPTHHHGGRRSLLACMALVCCLLACAARIHVARIPAPAAHASNKRATFNAAGAGMRATCMRASQLARIPAPRFAVTCIPLI
jgi:hypothetical protein